MADRERRADGTFELKGDVPRMVRSIRLSDETWEKLAEAATARGMSRADLVEQFVSDGLLGADEQHPGLLTHSQLDECLAEVMNDPAVTRNGKDRGAVKRAIAAIIDRLG